MAFRPSFTVVVSGIFIAYMLHSLWSLMQFFIPPKCEGTNKCVASFLEKNPQLNLILLTSTKRAPYSLSDYNHLHTWEKLNYLETSEKAINVTLPSRACRNGSLWLHAFVTTSNADWSAAINTPDTSYSQTRLTSYQIPEAATFSLLGEKGDGKVKKNHQSKPVTHFQSKITVSVMTELHHLSINEMAPDLKHILRFNKRGQYIPLLFINPLHQRIKDLVLVDEKNCKSELTLSYEPISLGKLRLCMQFEAAMSSMYALGFTEKDTDEVKGIFANTNLHFLALTVLISTFHLLFDFLAFKNDIHFWKNKKTMIGMSSRTVLWRAFSHAVIFVYLIESETSLLVLIPAGIGTIIEFWKTTKAFHITISWGGISYGMKTEDEKKTDEYDTQSMKYLSYLLYPLCIGGAIYSLIYMPHKSWFSWCINSLVNGVYAFGFIFMLPQLFVNYKLKSVAHLPWKAFMYKAFNTFIDDVFAFIITMPTAHRIACFRDDIVFII